MAIVGGGLAGLALADTLHAAGVDVRVFEARPRLGGRIAVLETPEGGVDLGPSWFWPGQPRMARLVAELGLRAFPQHAAGDICFEDERGTVHRGMGFASMEGAFRIEGGMVRLIEGLAARLPRERVHLSAPVAGVGEGVVLEGGGRCAAGHVVLALPPRIAAGLTFTPALPPEALGALDAIPTWMAGQAKFVAVYARPFWRAAGLSGDAMSRAGPLVEIHDASGPEAAPAALFGFVGVPAAARAGRGDAIAEAALLQFGRIFGEEALSPAATALMDWAAQPATATERDLGPPGGHPAQGLPAPLARLAEAGLHICVTETAPEMGGLMEGALASAERTAAQMLGSAPRS